ncbi:MAG: hypothetical protein Roseis2KO_19960 [Roseivirga sp.]
MAQQTVITKTKIPLGIQVKDTVNQNLLDLSSLCDGFDDQNRPLNLIIPSESVLVIFLPNTGIENINEYYRLERGEFKGEAFEILKNAYKPIPVDKRPYLTLIHENNHVHNGDSVLVVHQSGIFDGLTGPINVVRQLKNGTYADTVSVSVTGDFSHVRVTEVYLASEMAELMKNMSSLSVFDYILTQFNRTKITEAVRTRSYENWKEKGFIGDVDLSKLPKNPSFPNFEKNLFFKINSSSDSIRVRLKKSGKTKEITTPFSFMKKVIYLKDLSSGKYELILEEPRKHYGKRTTTYPFEIKSSFWNDGGYWLVILVPLFLILFLIYRTYSKAKINQLDLHKKISDAELKAIRAQLNPHFLFNSLNAIQNLVNKKDSEAANAYIVKLSRLLRIVLAHSDDTLHTLGQELEMSKLYIELEQMRTPFTFEMLVAEQTDQNVLVPSMILQPYLENAVIHGIVHGHGDHIRVSISNTDSSCVLKVEDNGKGSDKNNGNGKGMSLGKERLDIIARQLGNDIKIDVAAMKLPEGGFRVTIEIPKDL